MKFKRKDVVLELVKLGFNSAHIGFDYIVDALQIISTRDIDVRMGELYSEIASVYGKTASSIERCIRYEVQYYYENCKCHPLLIANSRKSKSSRIANREFIFRLYRILDKSEYQEVI